MHVHVHVYSVYTMFNLHVVILFCILLTKLRNNHPSLMVLQVSSSDDIMYMWNLSEVLWREGCYSHVNPK